MNTRKRKLNFDAHILNKKSAPAFNFFIPKDIVKYILAIKWDIFIKALSVVCCLFYSEINLKFYSPDLDNILLFYYIRCDLWYINCGIYFEVSPTFAAEYDISDDLIRWIKRTNTTIRFNSIYCKSLRAIDSTRSLAILEAMIKIEPDGDYSEKLCEIIYNLLNSNFSGEYMNYIDYCITLADEELK
jgi:hypothetical protein